MLVQRAFVGVRLGRFGVESGWGILGGWAAMESERREGERPGNKRTTHAINISIDTRTLSLLFCLFVVVCVWSMLFFCK